MCSTAVDVLEVPGAALMLVDDAGRFVYPEIPVDGCGKPLGWYDRDARPLVWNRLTYTDRVVRTR